MSRIAHGTYPAECLKTSEIQRIMLENEELIFLSLQVFQAHYYLKIEWGKGLG